MTIEVISPEENLKKVKLLDQNELVIVCKECGKGISNCQQSGEKWDLVCLNRKCKNTWRLNGTYNSIPTDELLEAACFKRITRGEFVRTLGNKYERERSIA